MASKDPDLDKPDLDDDLDIPDFDDSMLDGGNDKRTPIDKVTGGFYNGENRCAQPQQSARDDPQRLTGGLWQSGRRR